VQSFSFRFWLYRVKEEKDTGASSDLTLFIYRLNSKIRISCKIYVSNSA